MRNGVIVAGLGWITAGIVSAFVWIVINNSRICNCPRISVVVVSSGVSCCAPQNGNLYTAVIAISVGIIILLFGKRISAIMDKQERQNRKMRSS